MVKTLSSTQTTSSTRNAAHIGGPALPQKPLACTICSAQYAPAQSHAHLLQAPRIASESAFMSMCHFCFRCRRPACPLCWDDVHGICGACVEEVRLPFRQDVRPLPFDSTLLIGSRAHAQQRPHASFPLLCVSPGRFQTEVVKEVLPVSSATTIPEEHTIAAAKRPLIAPEKRENSVSMGRRIERVVTLLLALLLLCIAVLIVVASFSEAANTAIAQSLHVDIRMEIEYLLQLIQQNR